MDGEEFGLEDADFEAFVAAYHSASGSDASDCGTSDDEFYDCSAPEAPEG